VNLKSLLMNTRISPATWEQIKTAYASGIGLREIARNMQIPAGTVLARAKREGWTRQIATAKIAQRPDLARELAKPDAINAITPMQSVAITMQQRADRHVERMAGVTDRVLPHLEEMEPSDVINGIHEIEKFDRMARRNFGLGDGKQTGGSLSLRILTGGTAIEMIA
jgi:hypothetical protein